MEAIWKRLPGDAGITLDDVEAALTDTPALRVIHAQRDAEIANLIGRAWEASVALEGHGIEPVIRARLDEAIKRVRDVESQGPPSPSHPRRDSDD